MFPYIKCLKPIKICNRGKWLLVPCGKCVACVNRITQNRSLMCQLMENSYKYTMFVTLTYSDDYLPRFKIRKDYGHSHFLYVNLTPRLDKYISSQLVELSQTDFDSLAETYANTHWNDFLSYAPKVDAQNFLKRFRKHLNKYTNETFKYFLVSEYGEKFLRAHFHAQIFFESSEILQHFGEVLRSSWTYGRVDFSLSRGKVSGYVAGYLNSITDLPEVLCKGFPKPFQIHSKAFGLPKIEALIQTLYQYDPCRVMQLTFPVGNKLLPFSVFYKVENKCFPRCVGFRDTTLRGIYSMYSYYRTNAIRYKVSDIFNLTLSIWLNNRDLFTYEQIQSRLYFSKYFDNIVALTGRSYSYCINFIIQYYKLKENAYDLEKQKMCENGANWRLFDVNYHSQDLLTNDPAYNGFLVAEQEKARNNVKHKQINDLNKIHYYG